MSWWPARKRREARHRPLVLALHQALAMACTHTRSVVLCSFVVVASFVLPAVHTANAQTNLPQTGAEALADGDVELRLLVLDDEGRSSLLTTSEADAYLNQTRCRCGAPLIVRAVLTPTGIEKLKQESVQVALRWGSDCNEATTDATCLALTDGVLGEGTDELEYTIGADLLFKSAYPGVSDFCEGFEGSRTLWLVLWKDGQRLDFAASRSLRLDAKPPAAPVLEGTTSGEGALGITFTGSMSPSLQGHQALCTPGPAKGHEPAFASCTSPDTGDGGTGVKPCSPKIAPGLTTARIEGLDDGVTYRIALVAIDASGNVSAPSNTVTGTPGPTVGFSEAYEGAGGEAVGGCRFARAHDTKGSWGTFMLFVGLVWLRRRAQARRSRRMAIGISVALTMLIPAAAQASEGSLHAPSGSAEAPVSFDSPRRYALTLGLGFYRPGVDAEFSGDATPFATTFSSRRRPMWQLRLERFVWQGFGSLAVGFGVGHYRAQAKDFSLDGASRSADDTALRVVPLSLDVVYRLDPWPRLPLVPYVRAGLDQALWWMEDASGTDLAGGTPGWHAAAGLSLGLDALDSEAAINLDRDAGVNRTLVFVEVNHSSIEGFGSARKLRLSDTMLVVGLSLEL